MSSITISTNPSPAIPEKPTTITYTNTNIDQTANDLYFLQTNIGNIVSDVYTGKAPSVQPFITGLNTPSGMAVDSQGNFFVCDNVNGLIRKFNQNGNQIYTGGTLPFITLPVGTNPVDVDLDVNGNIYVASSNVPSSLDIYSATGVLLGSESLSATAYAISVVVDNQGYIYVLLVGGVTPIVNKYPPSLSTVTSIITSGIDTGVNLFIDSNNYLYISKRSASGSIVRCKLDGSDVTNFITGINNPDSITTDNNGNFIIVNVNPSSVQQISKYSPTGSLITSNFIQTNIPDTNASFIVDMYNNNIYYTTTPESTVYKATVPYTFYFNNVYLNSGLNVLTIYDSTTSQDIVSFNIDISTICFGEGTKILCHVTGDQETYIPIENIKDNNFVKTWKHGYKKVKYVIKSTIFNSSERTMNKLFRMKKTRENRLIKDLYVTGGHSILYNKLSQKQQHKMDNLAERFDLDECDMSIDGKQKCIAYYDDNFEEYNEEGFFNIYHLVLEPGNNYGIYANGLLVESTDEMTLSRMNGQFSVINNGFLHVNANKHRLKIKTNTMEIQNILDKYIKQKKAIENVKVEDIIKKKQFIYGQASIKKDKEEQKLREDKSEKSYTYKNTWVPVAAKKNQTLKRMHIYNM